jgi:hypothetical protein
MSTTTTDIELGPVRDLPSDVYHSLRYASNSILKILHDHSPAHAFEAMNSYQVPTPAMILGEAVHYCCLQPSLFATRYIVADQCTATTGKGKRCSRGGSVLRANEWFCTQHDPTPDAPIVDDGILSQDDFDTCLRISDRVNNHPMASAILKQRTDTELSIIWKDEASGVICKARLDIVVAPQRTVADLKTTISAKRSNFERSIFEYGYHRQAATYLDATGYKSFVFIPVEKTPPFAVATYRMKDNVIEAGREQNAKLLTRFGECLASGKWPAYSDEIEDIDLPSWAWKDMERID